MRELFTIFITFFKIGLFTFGGGYGMIPMLEREIVETKGWITSADLTDYFAISQCTPGIIAVNTATFVGNKQRGLSGGIVATLGVIFPSIIIITIVAGFLASYATNPNVQYALAGIRIAVCVLMTVSIGKLFKEGVKSKIAAVIFLVALCSSYFTNISTAILIISFSLLGILIGFIKKNKNKEEC